MKQIGHGDGYQYAHNEEDAVVTQKHFPDDVEETVLFEPVDRGFEKTLAERKAWLQARRDEKRGTSR